MTRILGMAMMLLVAAGRVVAADAAAPAAQPAKELKLDLGNNVTMKLVLIPAGKFLMGSPDDERGRSDGETQHEVTISKPFYMGIHEVMVDQYVQFAQATGQKYNRPAFKQTGDHPAVFVTWGDAQAFCDWLSKKGGRTVVLPTEAQWEYACRSGTKSRFSCGYKDNDLYDYAWYSGNSRDNDKHEKMTHPVGQKKPNAWGLHDMHGNVWEWCLDWYTEYAAADQTDPTGPVKGGLRVLRGGSWNDDPKFCRSANRHWINPGSQNVSYGFRVVAAAD